MLRNPAPLLIDQDRRILAAHDFLKLRNEIPQLPRINAVMLKQNEPEWVALGKKLNLGSR